jgi:hypothetical protein
MYFHSISETVFALTLALAQVPAVVGDFTVWQVGDVVHDCATVPTCKDIQSGLWVAAGPGRDDIGHSCPDALNANTATNADGETLLSTNGATEMVWPDGLCGLTSRYSCKLDGDVSDPLAKQKMTRNKRERC